jgi:hypothetical protein
MIAAPTERSRQIAAFVLLSPRSMALLILATIIVAALLLALPGLGRGGPVIHWPPNCPPSC